METQVRIIVSPSENKLKRRNDNKKKTTGDAIV